MNIIIKIWYFTKKHWALLILFSIMLILAVGVGYVLTNISKLAPLIDRYME